MGFRSKYTPTTVRRFSWLGLPEQAVETRSRRSFILAQIDGLSEANLQRGLRAGKLPYLSKLLREKKMVAGPWRAIVPTSTAAFSAGLFYGVYDRMPGFFWYDRKRARRMRMNNSEDTSWVESEISKSVAPYAGLLAGGSSYSALFTGGAENTFMTFSRLFSPRLNLSTKSRWIYLFFFSQIFLILRILYYSAIELLLSVYDLFKSFVSPHGPLGELRFLFPRIASVVICREIATLATILDIYRGVGPIYVNLFSYDEHAHYRGPNSAYAFWTLKGLDASMRRLWKSVERAKKLGIREYDLLILSDHGQVRSYPFHDFFEQLPQVHFDMLFRALYGGVQGTVTTPQEAREKKRRLLLRHKRQSLRRSMELLERQLQRTEEVVGRIVGMRLLSKLWLRWARGSLNKHEKMHLPDPQRRIQLVSTGPVAHLCLADRETPTPFEEWQEKYPKYLDVMAQHEGIGYVLCRTRSGGCKVGCRGEWVDLHDDAAIVQKLPAVVCENLHRHRDELHTLANLAWSGDFVLFGYGRPDHKVISYSFERGSHSGPSPEETTPFLMVPAERADMWPELSGFDRKNLLTLRQMHERLQAFYCQESVKLRETGVA